MPATARTATTLTHITPVTVPASPGLAADVTNGDSYPNGGSSLLVMNNTDTVSRTVSVSISTTVDGQSVTARTFTVPASTVQYVKLGPVANYGSTTVVTANNALVKLAVYAL